MATPLLNVRILTPKQTIFEGDVLSLSSTNSLGKFDVLAEHANFLTLVEGKPLKIVTIDGKRLQFNLVQALIYVTSNQVYIYTDILSSASS